MSTPSSLIKICSGVRLNNRYEHTVFFENASAQETYFAGKVVKTFSAYSYIRREWNLRVQATMSEAKSWSYLYFRNTGHENKNYFYFITSVQYVSDTVVELHLEMDVMQTHMFDYTLLRSFVEREHASSDAIGEHTIEEGLELGELAEVGYQYINLQELCILVMSTFDPITTTEENTGNVYARRYGNMFYGCGIYAVEKRDWTAWGTKLDTLSAKQDGIISMWMYPKALITLQEDYSWGDGMVTKEVESITPIFKEFSRNSVLAGGYKPRNNKLYTYPYNFMYVHNNAGASAVYKYELFGNPASIQMKIVGCVSPEASVKMYPINYNNIQHGYESGLYLADFPTCAWNQDVFKLWLANNQNQRRSAYANAIASGIGGALGGIAFGGVGLLAGGGAVYSSLSQINSLVAQKKDMEVQPPQAKGNASPSVNVANEFHSFVVETKSVRPEYAKVIDDYFDMYGYRVHRVKIPNRNVRENWTYTKTAGCHIQGNLCNEDLSKIENIYNNGITFWKNGDNIGNYSLSNNTL